MKGFKRRGIGLATGFLALALALAAPAAAQENLDSGKTGAQLYAADCAICHKSAQALKKSGGIFGLSSFLREHYTASRESAAAIASYLDSVASPPAQKKPAGATKRTAKGDEKAKADEKKAKPKSGDAKSEKPENKDKPTEAKTSEPKSESKSESKGEPKSEPKGEAKPSEPKSGEAKPAEAKTKDSKPAAAPAAKPDKPEKSD
jgi:outer membrane biosynthesis protein TonB